MRGGRGVPAGPAARMDPKRSIRGTIVPLKSPRLVLRRTWFAIGWLGIAAVIYLSLTPNPPKLDLEQGDKLQHLAAYGSLMLWFAQLAVARNRRLWTGIALIGLGVGLEFAQLALEYRTFSYADMVANAAGVAIGWLLATSRLPNMLTVAERMVARDTTQSAQVRLLR
jgi:VanZ family protein